VFTTTNGTIRLPVIGIAISPSQPRYPRQTPGVGWITEDKLSQIVPDRSRWHWLQTIRLQDPESASAFAEQAAGTFPSKLLDFLTWQEQRAEALNDASVINIIVIAYTVLLLIVLYSITTILVGERANKQYRQIGLLKAVGLTPNQISTIFLLESATLGIIAVAIGSIAGVVLAPILAAPSAETLISTPMVAPNVWHFFIAALAIIPVLLISAILATLKSTRFSVLQTIRAGTSLHPSRSNLTKFISRLNLPLPIMLGLKDLLARRKRFLWLMYTIAITGTVVVVTLSLQANINARPFGSDIPKEVPMLFYTLDLVLMLIMFTALIAVALLSVGERTREFGILKAIGFTPQQLSSSLIGTHAVLAAIASIASIPLGIGLYYFLYLIASGTTDDAGQIAPWWWLAMIPVGITLFTAIATIIPARNAAKMSAVSAIRYE
jgi:ABC-type antimicrobial peptide transport system permease subunit